LLNFGSVTVFTPECLQLIEMVQRMTKRGGRYPSVGMSTADWKKHCCNLQSASRDSKRKKTKVFNGRREKFSWL